MGAGTKFYRKQACSDLKMVAVPTDNSDETERNCWTAPEEHLIAEVDAVQGRVLFFDQQLVHEGVQPAAPYMKYIIRSDIMFHRTPELCTGEKDIEAFRMYRYLLCSQLHFNFS
jgi:hypothetical protein